MSGTDVAQEEVEEMADAPEVKRTKPMFAFLKIWLPFPLILGGILFFQFRSGELAPGTEGEGPLVGIFEGAGADLPLLMQTLNEERLELEREWGELRDMKRRILLEKGEIETRQQNASELLSRVEAKVQVMEEERDRMLVELARVYDTMKPGAAAEILSGVDVDTSTEILRRMKQRQAAQVMASLDPTAAARISQRMLRTP
jgi:flagellar motility protein MotE (MotC chaperone)